MKPSITDALRIGLIVAACAMLATGVQGADPSTGLSGRDVRIASVKVQDQQVLVTIANTTTAPARVRVTMQVRHIDGTQTATANTVTVFGRQKAFVVFSLRAPITGTPIVGMIVDDPSPF